MILSYVFNYETLNITNIALLKQRAGHVIIDKNVKLLYNLFLKSYFHFFYKKKNLPIFFFWVRIFIVGLNVTLIPLL